MPESNNNSSSKIKYRSGLPIKTIRYENELTDEFSSAIINSKKIDENYKYLHKSILWYVLRFILYRLIIMPYAFLYCKIMFRHKTKNRKILKKLRGKGVFVYANHTQERADAYIPTLSLFSKSVYIIVHPANVSQKIVGKTIIPLLGALPLPDTLKAGKNFKNAIEKRVLQGNAVVVYPEAHIWPYYTGIREFSKASFKYPSELDEPVIALTNTYKARKIIKRPKIVTYLDGPFYPDMTLPLFERMKKLRDEVYNTMKKRSELSNCEYIRYEKMIEENN